MKLALKQLHTVGLVATRIALGGYFTLAGFGKVRGELSQGLGTFRNSDSFLALQPAWLPDIFATPYGLVLPWAEVAIGITLAVGFFTRISAALTLGMLVSFTIVLMSAAGLSGGSPGPFHPNVFMILIAATLIGAGGYAFALDQFLQRKPSSKPAIKSKPAHA